MTPLKIKKRKRISSMSRIGFVACCKTKLDRPAPAKELYQSPLFTLTRRYVEREIRNGKMDGWFVLSALHGIVEPEQVVEPYDVTLSKVSKQERDAWSGMVTEQINYLWSELLVRKFTVFAGVYYCTPFYKFNTDLPLCNWGIGERLAFLKESLGDNCTEHTEQLLLF